MTKEQPGQIEIARQAMACDAWNPGLETLVDDLERPFSREFWWPLEHHGPLTMYHVHAWAACDFAASIVAAFRVYLKSGPGDIIVHQGSLDLVGFIPNNVTETDKFEYEDAVRLLSGRQQYRKSRNWAAADRIRDKLIGWGYEIRDCCGGTMFIARRYWADL